MRSELFGAFLLFFYGGFFTTLYNTVSPVLPANGDADFYEPDLNSRIFFLFFFLVKEEDQKQSTVPKTNHP